MSAAADKGYATEKSNSGARQIQGCSTQPGWRGVKGRATRREWWEIQKKRPAVLQRAAVSKIALTVWRLGLDFAAANTYKSEEAGQHERSGSRLGSGNTGYYLRAG